MVKEDRSTWKANYFVRVVRLFDDYPKCFVVGIDNVRSNQMQQIRKSLRGQAEILMGKNTMMKKAIRGHLQKNPHLEKVMTHLKGNVGLVFTREDACDIKEKIVSNKISAPAKAGAVAPCDVVVPAQNTGLGPEKTSFFQALQIQTKISKGTIEILNDVKLIKEGEKVGASEATLLNMLKIHPFSYGLVIRKVYDNGTIFDPDVLDITDAELKSKFCRGVSELAAVCLAVNYPTMASAPHMLANSYRKILSIAIASGVSFPAADKLRDLLSDPSKLAALTASAAPAAAAPAADTGKKAAETKKEEEPEEEEEMSLSLFD
jgi:large subunit ribosomal protein LP0